MGQMVIARCACGFQTEHLPVGAGAADFTRTCAFPGYCLDGDHLLTVDLFHDPPRCPEHPASQVVAYDDPLVAEPGPNQVAGWRMPGQERERVLTDGDHYCPRCNTFRLRFRDGMLLWD